jgi:hypothetical protein
MNLFIDGLDIHKAEPALGSLGTGQVSITICVRIPPEETCHYLDEASRFPAVTL